MDASSIRELPLAFVRSSASCVRNTHQLTSEERILRPATMAETQFNTHPQCDTETIKHQSLTVLDRPLTLALNRTQAAYLRAVQGG